MFYFIFIFTLGLVPDMQSYGSHLLGFNLFHDHIFSLRIEILRCVNVFVVNRLTEVSQEVTNWLFIQMDLIKQIYHSKLMLLINSHQANSVLHVPCYNRWPAIYSL